MPEIKPDRAIVTMASVLYDAVLVADREGSAEALAGNGEAVHYVAEAYRHAKPLGALGAGARLLEAAPLRMSAVPGNGGNGVQSEAGVVVLADGTGDVAAFGQAFVEALAAHRHHDLDLAAVPA